jgi:hypothetical protein
MLFRSILRHKCHSYEPWPSSISNAPQCHFSSPALALSAPSYTYLPSALSIGDKSYVLDDKNKLPSQGLFGGSQCFCKSYWSKRFTLWSKKLACVATQFLDTQLASGLYTEPEGWNAWKYPLWPVGNEWLVDRQMYHMALYSLVNGDCFVWQFQLS